MRAGDVLRRSAAHLAAPEPQSWRAIDRGFAKMFACLLCLLRMSHVTAYILYTSLFFGYVVGDDEDDDGDDADEEDEDDNADE